MESIHIKKSPILIKSQILLSLYWIMGFVKPHWAASARLCYWQHSEYQIFQYFPASDPQSIWLCCYCCCCYDQWQLVKNLSICSTILCRHVLRFYRILFLMEKIVKLITSSSLPAKWVFWQCGMFWQCSAQQAQSNRIWSLKAFMMEQQFHHLRAGSLCFRDTSACRKHSNLAFTPRYR